MARPSHPKRTGVNLLETLARVDHQGKRGRGQKAGKSLGPRRNTLRGPSRGELGRARGRSGASNRYSPQSSPASELVLGYPSSPAAPRCPYQQGSSMKRAWGALLTGLYGRRLTIFMSQPHQTRLFVGQTNLLVRVKSLTYRTVCHGGASRTRRSAVGPTRDKSGPSAATLVRAGLREQSTKAMFPNSTLGEEHPAHLKAPPPPTRWLTRTDLTNRDALSLSKVRGVAARVTLNRPRTTRRAQYPQYDQSNV